MARVAITKAVGSRELKTRLGAYLRAVRLGVTITVTERGVPVATLSPIEASDRGPDAGLDELVALGLVSRGTEGALARHSPARVRGEPIGRTLDRDRDDRV